MLSTDNWFNNTNTFITAWSGSTFFTATNIFEQIQGDVNPVTIIGWIFTTGFAILAGYSRWRLNRSQERQYDAEARKINAEAERQEKINLEDYEDLLINQCNDLECMYRQFYDKFNPILIKHFENKEK
jgi:hypothetical protein